jgi:hypothetical protein
MKSILLRITEEDHTAWSGEARWMGVSLSAWIRLKCGGHIQSERKSEWLKKDSEELIQSDLGSALAIAAHTVKAERKAKQSESRTCPHGIAVGWRCTLCGSKVV